MAIQPMGLIPPDTTDPNYYYYYPQTSQFDQQCVSTPFSNEQSNQAQIVNERTRLISINEAFELLRFHIPTFPYERRLSKIDTLHLAIAYISLLESVMESNLSLYDYLRAYIDGYRFNMSRPPTWATSGNFL